MFAVRLCLYDSLGTASRLPNGSATASFIQTPPIDSTTSSVHRRIQLPNSTSMCLSFPSQYFGLLMSPSVLYLLGYMPSHNRIYLVDRDMAVYAYSLSLAVVEYQTAILRRDLVGAASLLEAVPEGEKNKVARFLEAQGTYHQLCSFMG